MKLLTIDTSSGVCSIALTSNGEAVSECLIRQERTLAGRLLDCIDSVLAGGGLRVADLDGFGVALGPGSFTGLRVGIATVKGLALATGRPAVGFSSLAMLAMNLPWALYPVCPLFDARKGEVYAGLYSCRGLPEPLMEDTVSRPADLLDRLSGTVLFVGDGALRYRETIVERMGERAVFAPPAANAPRAVCGAILAETALLQGQNPPLSLLSPRYIRPSEAELARMRPHP